MKKTYCILLIFICYSVYSQEYTPTYFSKNKLQYDLIFLKEKITQIHPKFTDKQFKNKWNKEFEKTFSKINDSMSFNGSYIMFSSLMSVLQDGHSNLIFPYTERMKYMKSNGKTMPFTVKIKANKIYIDKYFSENNRHELINSEVLSINNISSKSILQQMQVFYGAKKQSIINHNLEKYFGAYFWTLFGQCSEYTVETVKNNTKVKHTLKAISNDKYFALKNKFYPKQTEKKYDLLFCDNCAYLKIKSFANNKTLSDFLSNAFDTIKINKAENLIIDVRDNFGGASRCVDTLLSYLTNTQYQQYQAIGVKISDAIKQKYKIKDTTLFNKIKDKNNGQMFYYSDDMLSKKVVNRNHKFNGKVFVLINENTYSAAATFAGVVKEFNLGKIIGTAETGGTIEYFGDFLFFGLPNTKMRFFVSPKIFKQYGNEDINKGVSPNINIKVGYKYDDIVKISQVINNL